MRYKHMTLGIMALAVTAASVPAYSQTKSIVILGNVEQTSDDSDCVLGKFSKIDRVTLSRTAATKALKGDKEIDPKLVAQIKRNMKKCAGKMPWNSARNNDAAAFSTVLMTHSGMALNLKERGIDSEKIDAWFYDQGPAFKKMDLDSWLAKDGAEFGLRVSEGRVKTGLSVDTVAKNKGDEEFGRRVSEGAIKAGLSADKIAKNLGPLTGYIATSILLETLLDSHD